MVRLYHISISMLRYIFDYNIDLSCVYREHNSGILYLGCMSVHCTVKVCGAHNSFSLYYICVYKLEMLSVICWFRKDKSVGSTDFD